MSVNEVFQLTQCKHGEVFLVQAMRAYTGSRGTAPLAPDLGTRRSGHHQAPADLPPARKERLLPLQAWWDPWIVWTFSGRGKSLDSTGTRTADRLTNIMYEFYTVYAPYMLHVPAISRFVR